MLFETFFCDFLFFQLNLCSETVSSQANTVMAIVATIFLPLTFLSGVFGMNFVDPTTKETSMPLLINEFGYQSFWLITAVFALYALWKVHKWGYVHSAGLSTKNARNAGLFIVFFLFCIQGWILYWQLGHSGRF